MNTRPILFSGPMVRALLDDSKTQTRRVLKQATGPSLSVGIDDAAPGVAELSWLWGDGPGHDVHETIKRVPCPYGQPGDRLWVRESWMDISGTGVEARDPHTLKLTRYAYMADTPAGSYADQCRKEYGLKWRPSIHMPRVASRITLEITGVRVERLQDISEADAIAEGIEKTASGFWSLYGQSDVDGTYSPRASYRALWEQINGPGSWDANPWVWVVEFRREATCN